MQKALLATCNIRKAGRQAERGFNTDLANFICIGFLFHLHNA